VVYEAPWIHEAASIPNADEIDHAYQFCRELVHSLFGEPLASLVKVYCPVPSDHKDVEQFIRSLHADGFYFVDPKQLTTIDEEMLLTKAETARQAKEVAEVEAVKEEAKEVTEAEAVKEEAKEVTEAEAVKEEAKEVTEAEAVKEEAKEVAEAEAVKEEAKGIA